jgi:hypothetical protein
MIVVGTKMSQPAAILGGVRCATAVVPRRRILARPLIAPWERGDIDFGGDGARTMMLVYRLPKT